MRQLGEDLRRYFRQRVNNTCDAEDLVGQTWLAAGRNFEHRSTLRHYMYSIARRLLSNYGRTRRYRPWVFSSREDPETLSADTPEQEIELVRALDLRRFEWALAQLPEHYAAVIELTMQGHGHLAVAELLGINYNTVRSRYNRGKAMLMRYFDDGRRDI